MKNGSSFGSAKHGIGITIRVITWISTIALGAMVLLVVANVLGRFVFRTPVPGTVELVELVAVVVVFFAVAYTQLRRGHVVVELVITRFPMRTQSILASVMFFLSFVYFGIMGWRGGVLAWSYMVPRLRETYVLSIPFPPFMFVLALGAVILALQTLIHVFEPIPPERAKQEEAK